MEGKGYSFEKDVELVFQAITGSDNRTIVTHNENISGLDGERQFDVIIRTTVAGEELLTVIECKDYSRPVDVTKIDTFHSKLVDIKASKGILVARNGFSKTARQKARRLGITLCTVDKLSNKLENPMASLPVIFRHINPNAITVELSLAETPASEWKMAMDLNNFISGVGLMEVINGAPISDLIEEKKISIDLDRESFGQPIWVKSTDGRSIFLETVTISAKLDEQVHFGYACELPSTFIKADMDGKSQNIVFDLADFEKIEGHLVRYNSIDSVPVNLREFHIAAISLSSKIDYVENTTLKYWREDAQEWISLKRKPVSPKARKPG